jgi:uncharacterized protein (TIGR02145 family)
MALAMVLTFSCSSGNNNENPPSSSSEALNGNSSSSSEEYGTAEVGEQIWLARNLNYNVPGSKCYGEDGAIANAPPLSNAEIQANCDKYGRLYNWATAMDLPSSCNFGSCASQIQSKHRGICPEGWHIPSHDEWNALFSYASNESSKLKATSGWIDHDGLDRSGTDDYGFSALPGGLYEGMSSYYDAAGHYGQWWVSTEYDDSNFILVRYMAYYGDMADQLSTLFHKSNMHSVRCLKD